MSIPSWAVKGARVVCIRAAHGPLLRPSHELVAGNVYTIACAYMDDEIGSGPYVDLMDGGRGWWLNRFRPLVSEQDDIETHFSHHLKTDHRATRKQGEDA